MRGSGASKKGKLFAWHLFAWICKQIDTKILHGTPIVWNSSTPEATAQQNQEENFIV